MILLQMFYLYYELHMTVVLWLCYTSLSLKIPGEDDKCITWKHDTPGVPWCTWSSNSYWCCLTCYMPRNLSFIFNVGPLKFGTTLKVSNQHKPFSPKTVYLQIKCIILIEHVTLKRKLSEVAAFLCLCVQMEIQTHVQGG